MHVVYKICLMKGIQIGNCDKSEICTRHPMPCFVHSFSLIQTFVFLLQVQNKSSLFCKGVALTNQFGARALHQRCCARTCAYMHRYGHIQAHRTRTAEHNGFLRAKTLLCKKRVQDLWFLLSLANYSR